MAVVTNINIEGDSLHVISTQTRMKETPCLPDRQAARGPERHYEGVAGSLRFATSVRRDETVVHLILDVLDFLGSFKKNRNTVRYSCFRGDSGT